MMFQFSIPENFKVLSIPSFEFPSVIIYEFVMWCPRQCKEMKWIKMKNPRLWALSQQDYLSSKIKLLLKYFSIPAMLQRIFYYWGQYWMEQNKMKYKNETSEENLLRLNNRGTQISLLSLCSLQKFYGRVPLKWKKKRTESLRLFPTLENRWDEETGTAWSEDFLSSKFKLISGACFVGYFL